MATPVQENLRARNVEYVSKFDKGHLALPPAKKYTVVTCMDARIDPARAYGIDLGDAHVIRNAGGHVRPALRDILISQQLLGTQEVLVIKHTGCGMLLFKNEDALDLVEKNLGTQARVNLTDFDFHTITDLEQAVRDDVGWLKNSGFVTPEIPVTGWVYDVAIGKVVQIV